MRAKPTKTAEQSAQERREEQWRQDDREIKRAKSEKLAAELKAKLERRNFSALADNPKRVFWAGQRDARGFTVDLRGVAVEFKRGTLPTRAARVYKEPHQAYQFLRATFKLAQNIEVTRLRAALRGGMKPKAEMPFDLDASQLVTIEYNPRVYQKVYWGTRDEVSEHIANFLLWRLRYELLAHIYSGRLTGIETVFSLPSCAAILRNRKACRLHSN